MPTTPAISTKKNPTRRRPRTSSPMTTWKQIPGYEGRYSVSNRAQVRSEMRKKWRILKPSLDGCRYLTVSLYKERSKRTHKIHRLFAENFIPNPRHLPEVNHKNGKRHDNRRRNLEWTTTSGNVLHAYQKLGHLRMQGEKCGGSKLKTSQVRRIWKFLSEGKTLLWIGNKFRVHFATISVIKRGLSWRHLRA